MQVPPHSLRTFLYVFDTTKLRRVLKENHAHCLFVGFGYTLTLPSANIGKSIHVAQKEERVKERERKV
jgi:hypothetical protein